MVAVRVSALITEDRQLIVKLPENIPAGPVELEIRTLATSSAAVINPALEAARAKFTAAMLSSTHHTVEDITPLSIEERIRAGTMPPDARPSEEIIQEIRSDD